MLNYTEFTTGLGIGLSVLAGFLCFTLRLFSKARHVETRGFGDAACPPTIMVEGKRAEEEESWSRTSSRSRVYTPGTPLTPSQVRPPLTPSQVRPPLNPTLQIRLTLLFCRYGGSPRCPG